MNRETATREIKSRWRDFYPADGRGRGKGIICPICGSGSGKDATGISCMKGGTFFLKCWNGGCDFNRGGSVIDLYMMEHGMQQDEFSKAVDEMAAEIGITIDPYTGRQATAAEDFAEAAAQEDSSFSGGTSSTQDATEAAEQPANFGNYYLQCRQNLLESAEAQAYLQRRGISLDLAIKYFIGFDPAWISPTVIKKQLEKGSNWMPQPKPCIILPSTLAHYVARDIRPAEQLDEQGRKYAKMNEGQPGIFGYHKAFEPTTGAAADIVFVCEGAFDALSVLEAGQQAIGLNSTSNADALIKKLEEHPTAATLVICLDNDEAGKKTAERLKDGLRRLNISYCSADICGSAKDPNESLTADRAAFEAAIAKAVASTAARPDNTAAYLDGLMAGEIEKFKQGKDRKTGFPNLDEKAGGLYSGLYVLAAISSLGKTTFALQMADQLAAAGNDVLFFSMEQSRLEMVSKSLARMTAQADMKNAVTSLSIRKGYLPAQVVAAADQYKRQTGERLSIIEGNFNADISFIGDYIRQYIRRNDARPVVMIDYLQILQPAADGKSRLSKKDEIDLAVTELKRLSRELDLTIIVISSLNRMNYQTPVAFESLKESGGIEYTCDVVWGLQLACLDEDLFDGDNKGKVKAQRKRINDAKAEEPRKIKLVCLKNRYGISSYDCAFEYYPAFDLFVPAKTVAAVAPQQHKRKY